MIYGGIEAEGVSYAGVEEALRVPQTDIRLFGKPAAFERRRMGVALAYGNNVDDCRSRAQRSANLITVHK